MKKIILLSVFCISTLFTFSQIKNPISGLGTAGYLPKFASVKTLSNSAVSQTTLGINSSIGNITLGTTVGTASISSIYMNATPTATNYVVSGTTARATTLNGNTLIFGINGTAKANMSSTVFQSVNPFYIGDTAPTGATKFLVTGGAVVDGTMTVTGQPKYTGIATSKDGLTAGQIWDSLSFIKIVH